MYTWFCPCPELLKASIPLQLTNRTRVDLTDVHREHLDRGEPFPAAASPVRRAHDGAVQGRQLWGAQSASLRDRRRLLQVCVFWSIISVDTIRFIG